MYSRLYYYFLARSGKEYSRERERERERVNKLEKLTGKSAGMSDSRRNKQSSEVGSIRKRKFLPNPGSHRIGRGGPAVILTCETGREHKCKMQGLDILRYYLEGGDNDDTAAATPAAESKDGGAALSLEEELNQLQQSNKKQKKKLTEFTAYDTGCRGSVFMLCTMDSCQLIPPIQTEYMKSKIEEAAAAAANDESSGSTSIANLTKDKDGGNNNEGSKEPEAKRIRQDFPNLKEISTKPDDNDTSKDNTMRNNDANVVPPWDPITLVTNVFADARKKSSNAPSSRFVTRMIPIQATCYASAEELDLTTKSLLHKYLPATAQSFAVAIKKRHCDNLSRDQIIRIVASQVVATIPNCKVKLDDPDVTILVEICRTLCGVSVVENCASFKKFNLAISREHAL